MISRWRNTPKGEDEEVELPHQTPLVSGCAAHRHALNVKYEIFGDTCCVDDESTMPIQQFTR
jgi:hypothetical protein